MYMHVHVDKCIDGHTWSVMCDMRSHAHTTMKDVEIGLQEMESLHSLRGEGGMMSNSCWSGYEKQLARLGSFLPGPPLSV